MCFSIPLITFDSFCLLLRHKMSSLLNATLHVEPLAGLHVQLAGLPVLRSLLHRLKPTAALRHFDTEVHRHILDLSETQSITLRHERAQPLNLEMPPEYGLPRHTSHVVLYSRAPALTITTASPIVSF